MNTIWTIAIKDLRVIGRDRTGLLFILFIPIVFAIFFGSMYGGDQDDRSITLAVVDEDQTEASEEFVQGLIQDEAFEVETMDLLESESGVRQGDYAARLRIKRGFGVMFRMSSMGVRPEIELGFDPTMRAEAAILEGLLSRNAMTQLGFSSDMSPVNLTTTPIFDNDTASEPTPFDLSFPQGIVWGLMSVAMAFTTSLVNERTTGTLLRLEIAPIRRIQILAGKATACFLMNIAVMILLMIMGVGCFGIKPVSWPLLVVAFISVSSCMTGIMMILATFGQNERTTTNVGWTVMMLLAMIGGGMIPLFFMSDWMASLSQFSPIMWSITALEGALWRGYTLQEMLLPCGILLGVGAASFATGAARFR
jgi:ABC-2 type transport system permease protein